MGTRLVKILEPLDVPYVNDTACRGDLISLSTYLKQGCKLCLYTFPQSAGVDTVTYDVWSFVLLISEPFLRPLAILGFYFRYLMTDMMAAY